MKVNVLYFSSIRDKLGKQQEEIEFEGGSIKDFKEKIAQLYPDIKDNLDKVMFAVNEEYVDLDFVVKEGDTIGIIPPVSGG
ncbi:MAG: molybdopterin converting factor subunit 1 [Hydrogenothermaceae bacterium]|nr:molybdopterin converting factor subunit 1 [Hydrogenothermaceae bacterium]